MNGTVHAYLFEAKGIQRYIFFSGKLRDVVGASDLVAQIANRSGEDWIGQIVGDKGLNLSIIETVTATSDGQSISFSRRAGGAFCLHCTDKETLVKVRRAIRLKVMRCLPGLEISDALGCGTGEIGSRDAAFAASGAARANSAASVLPLGRPVIAIVPRTGLPKTAEKQYGQDVQPLDAILTPQRDRADELQVRMGTAPPDDPWRWIVDGPARRFHGTPEGRNEAFAYPRNLDDKDEDSAANPLFPFLGRDHRVGLVHADLSGLGQLFAGAQCQTAAAGLALGNAIEAAVERAIQAANHAVLLDKAQDHSAGADNFRKIVPARPLVIGGDDMTIIVRADLALPFTARLLEALEVETAKLKDENQHDWQNLPKALTACAGVAIARAGLPFLTMNALAESLCKYAKKKAKAFATKGEPYPSMLAFHVQTHTAQEDYADDILPSINCTGRPPLTANPYRIGKHSEHLKEQHGDWSDLIALAQAIADSEGCGNALRKIKGLVSSSQSAEAQRVWDRLLTRHDGRRVERVKAAAAKFPGARFEKYALPACGALFDALELIDLGAVIATQGAQSQPEEQAA